MKQSYNQNQKAGCDCFFPRNDNIAHNNESIQTILFKKPPISFNLTKINIFSHLNIIPQLVLFL